jgi:protein-tyrosine phosphatase
LERLKVVWRYPETVRADSTGRPISEPKPGEPIIESHAADWRQNRAEKEGEENKPPLPERGVSETAPASTDTSSPVPTKESARDEESVQELERQLGLRQQTDASKDVSLAGSEDEERAVDGGRVAKGKGNGNGNGDIEGVRSYFKNGQEEG